MPRVMFRNAAMRAAQNMKIVTTKTSDGQFEARVAGQDMKAVAPTEQLAVRQVKDMALASAKTDNLSGFQQKVF